ncbi:hypothetical protein I6G82_17590 [Lysinibacillus macroides]|uniref:hypothetical protein n=1 Tax=Lysinibacillus macroides TaxID=33935 RepID=UPI0006B63A6E|nr:hypothetical protein [Lysinibacillus macroides]QPR67048.1 hypothetical protein I6G82_17590 [Lysinibacillus macroides]
MKKESKLLLLILTISIATVLIIPVSVNFMAQSKYSHQVITLHGIDIARGTYSGGQFIDKYRVSKRNGEMLNFWIKNTGNTDIKITIDEKGGAIFQPGEQGHISTSVGFFAKTYEFKAAPLHNGGNIRMEYGLSQR